MGVSLSSLSQSHRPKNKYSQIQKQQQRHLWIQKDQNQQNQLWQQSWKDITHQNIYYRREYGKFQIFKNQITAEEIEKYKIVLNNKQEYQKWKQIIQWRNLNQYLVKVQHFDIHNQAEVCVKQYQVNLFVERAPLRLADLTDIPYPENLYFLLAAIKGFKYIFSYPEPLKNFKITESLICVTKQGLIKVWLNPNLSETLPVQNLQNQVITQQQILKSIIDIIEQNTDRKDYPYPFRQYLYEKKIIVNGDFNLIIQQLYSYARDMKITIPKCAVSVKDVLNKDLYNTQKLQTDNSMMSNPNNFRQEINSGKDNHSSFILKAPQLLNTNMHQEISFKEQIPLNSLFPRQKTHGLRSQTYEQSKRSHLHAPNLNIVQKKQQNMNLNINTNQHLNRPQPSTDRVHYQNLHHYPVQYPNQYLNQNTHIQTQPNIHQVPPVMINNNMVNNMAQYPPQLVYKPRFIQNKQFIQSRHPRQTHSLEKSNHILQSSTHSNAPPGYRMVQRKIIHPPGFNLDHQGNSSTVQQYNYPPPNQQIYQNLFISKPPNYQEKYFISPQIQRTNSVAIKKNELQMPIIQNRIPSLQKSVHGFPAQTIRPEQVKDTVRVERISRQSSAKTFSNTNSNQNLIKSSSFKNNLLKSHNINVQQSADMKYFTKKDSEQTLDPQIAADLMKYMQNN